MNNRGVAVVEGLTLIGVLLLIIGLVLAIAYLWFARSYVEYRSEQALFCVAEGGSPLGCRQKFRRDVQAQLPFGRVQSVDVTQTGKNWRFNSRWGWESNWLWGKKNYVLQTEKQLSIKRVSKANVDLP